MRKNKKQNESWDERYAKGDYNFDAPHPLLVSLVKELPPGTALDLACGAGRHASLLAENGWRVAAVDASKIGLEIARRRAREKSLEIDFRLADLEKSEFAIEENAYDLICDFFYLQRDLFAPVKRGLKTGGVFAAAIHFHAAGEAAGRFTLAAGELKSYFEDFEILHYREIHSNESGAPRNTAEIIARKSES